MSLLNAPFIELLNKMDYIIKKHPILEDTMSREAMWDVLDRALREGKRKKASFQYWTFNPIADWRVRRALNAFLFHPKVIEFMESKDESERGLALSDLMADRTVVSKKGETIDEYFGDGWSMG